MAMKTCSQCGITKPWSEFYFVTSRGKPRANCTECVNRKRRQVYEDHRFPECYGCHGEGVIENYTCRVCGGSGRVSRETADEYRRNLGMMP